MGWIDDLLGKIIQKNGVAVPDRKTVNFVGDMIDIEDNPGDGTTEITIRERRAITDLENTVEPAVAGAIYTNADATAGIAIILPDLNDLVVGDLFRVRVVAAYEVIVQVGASTTIRDDAVAGLVTLTSSDVGACCELEYVGGGVFFVTSVKIGNWVQA